MSWKYVLAVTLCVGGLSADRPALAQNRPNVIPASIEDLNAAQLVEVRDKAGTVVLHGTLKTESTKSAKVERSADLEDPSGGQADGMSMWRSSESRRTAALKHATRSSSK